LTRIVSVNVGEPREARWRGRLVRTAIWKQPVAGRVHVGKFNIEGDRQADPAVHGGLQKAVYVYPSEHYAYWRPLLGELAWGAFGENLTTEGLLESAMHVGDRLQVGTAILEVTQPRTPCVKLALRFQRPSIVREFAQARRSGFYCAVVREGDVGAGDPVSWEVVASAMPTVAALL
jgi:MOSC domain-containing protein YiiM